MNMIRKQPAFKAPATLFRRGFALFLAIFFVCTSVQQAFASQKQGLPGRVRVLLTAYQNLTQLDIGVHGSYTLDDKISFQRGSQVQLAVINNRLQVSYEGMVYLTGHELIFKQHQADSEGENGLRFSGTMSLFPGDLQVSAKDGKLQMITVLPIEEYLSGVVPYEMADDFPLEALKAQAVAARTYTLARLDKSKPYDLVDNTNDQVYRGIQKDKVNAIKAVHETSGLVLTYQDKLANCLYTASNGGYTESALNAWGRESIPYLQIQKDPYDLDNPLSIVKTATIQKERNGADSITDSFFEFLKQRLDKKDQDAKIISINSLTPHTPKYGQKEGGVMNQLKVDLSIQVTSLVEVKEKADDTEVSLTVTSPPTEPENQVLTPKYIEKTETKEISLDVPVFPDLEQLLSLSINRNENEIISVKESDKAFKVQFRRYGHGVGMSQRGAEWMAKTHQFSFERILGFYYPGTKLEKWNLPSETLTTLSAAFVTTPGPPPTATPRPTLMPQSGKPQEGQRIVHVMGIESNSSLNLRAKPDYLGDIITRLYYGQELLVLRTLEDGWLEVKTDAVQGYIREEFVSTKPD